MLVLAIDTATPDLLVGVARGGGVLKERVIPGAKRHNEVLMPTVLEVLEAAGLELGDLEGIVVGVGPGPFTGLRVGMSTAAALGQALGIPVTGVCSHLAFVCRCAARTLVVTDARRREVYWSVVQGGEIVEGPQVQAPHSLEVQAEAVVVPECLAELLPAHLAQARRVEASPSTKGLVVAANFADPAPLTPLYLRRPDAKAPTIRISPAVPVPAASAQDEKPNDVRELQVSDAAACAFLEAVLFAGDSPWNEHMFKEEIASEYTTYFGLFDGEQLVGYAGIGMAGPEQAPEWEVHTIGVDPKLQGKGLGRRLLRLLLETSDAKGGDVFLEVRTTNAAAIGLYESEGFVGVGVRPRYYQPSGADALVMRRESTGARREADSGAAPRGAVPGSVNAHAPKARQEEENQR